MTHNTIELTIIVLYSMPPIRLATCVASFLLIPTLLLLILADDMLAIILSAVLIDAVWLVTIHQEITETIEEEKQ